MTITIGRGTSLWIMCTHHGIRLRLVTLGKFMVMLVALLLQAVLLAVELRMASMMMMRRMMVRMMRMMMMMRVMIRALTLSSSPLSH